MGEGNARALTLTERPPSKHIPELCAQSPVVVDFTGASCHLRKAAGGQGLWGLWGVWPQALGPGVAPAEGSPWGVSLTSGAVFMRHFPLLLLFRI